mgnify:FL=1
MEKLQCSVCGGALVMSDDGEKAVCESCGMSFKKETVKKMIMELSGPVKVEGIQNSDSLADRAETFLRLGETEKAHAAFRQMTDEYPADYRGWWGLTRLMDWEKYFYDSGTGKAAMPLVCKRALEFAPEEAKEEIRTYFENQISAVKTWTDQRHRDEQAATDQRHRDEQAAEEEYQKRLKIYEKAIEEVREKLDHAEAQLRAEEAVSANSAKELKEFLDDLSPNVRKPVRKGNVIALVVGCVFAAIALSPSVGVTNIEELLTTISFVALPLGLLLFRKRRASKVENRIETLNQAITQSWDAQRELDSQINELNAEMAALRHNAPVRRKTT